MNRYKARQAGLNIVKSVGRTMLEGLSSTVSGLRYIHNQKSSYPKASAPRMKSPSIPKIKSFKMPKMKSPIMKDFHIPNLPADIRKKLNQEAIASGKQPRW